MSSAFVVSEQDAQECPGGQGGRPAPGTKIRGPGGAFDGCMPGSGGQSPRSFKQTSLQGSLTGNRRME
jgi:hypothetical protein